MVGWHHQLNRHAFTKAAPSRGRRVSALSAGDAQSLWPVVSLRTCCLDSKKRGRERSLSPMHLSSRFTYGPPLQNHDLAFHSLACHTHRASLEYPLFFSPSRKIQPILRRPAEALPPLGSPSDLQAGLDSLSSTTPMHSGSQSVVPGSAASISKFLPSTPDLLNQNLYF